MIEDSPHSMMTKLKLNLFLLTFKALANFKMTMHIEQMTLCIVRYLKAYGQRHTF